MRAKNVFENVNFKRGQDPRASMDIGFDKELKLEQNHGDFKVWTYGDLTFYLSQNIRPPWDWELKLLSDDGEYEEEIYIDTIPEHYSDYQRMERAKNLIKEYLSKNESVNFKRGADPKKSMDIGIEPYDRKRALSIPWERENPSIIIKDFLKFNKIIKLIDYKGYVIMVTKYDENKRKYKLPYHSLTYPYVPNYYKPGWFATQKDCEERTKYNIDKYLEKENQNILETVNFERGLDPRDAMKVGVDKNNYFYGVGAKPLRDMIEKNGLWPDGQALDILEVASELLKVPEDEVMVATENGDYITTTTIEYYMDDHDWEYADDEGHTENFDLILSSTGEIYVVEIDEGIPYMMLGPKF